MNKLILATVVLLSTFFTSITVFADGNRYGLERRYHSEISAAAAYLATNHDLNHRFSNYNGGRDRHDRHRNAVIIDVRTIEEYVGGHPPGAYSIPYPHIYNRQNNPDKGDYIGQPDEDFVAAVEALNLPKDTLIITMCRTGFRSVNAGNLLADAGYTNVRNMWQGFKGNLKQDNNGEDADLDGDGIANGSDPYSGDLDGWANFQSLPVSMKLSPSLLYSPYMSMYFNVPGER